MGNYRTAIWLLGATASAAGCQSDVGSITQEIAVTTNVEVSTQQLASNTRLQAEPAVSHFGSSANPRFVTCGADTAARGVARTQFGYTAWSGTSCYLEAANRLRFAGETSVYAAPPWPGADSFTDGHVSLAVDPTDTTTVWISTVTNWDTALAGRRRSLGIGRLRIAADNKSLDVLSGDFTATPSPDITEVLGSNVESSATNGSGPFFPTLLISSQSNSERLGPEQYLVFLQRDNTGTKPRERIGIVRRDTKDAWRWHDAKFVSPLLSTVTSWSNSGDNWDVVEDSDNMRFMRPTAAISPDGSRVGIAFGRISYIQTSLGLANGKPPGHHIEYYFAEYNTTTDTLGPTQKITPPNMPLFAAASVRAGDPAIPINALPYPTIVHDFRADDEVEGIQRRWVVSLTTQRSSANGMENDWRIGTATIGTNSGVTKFGNFAEATLFTTGAATQIRNAIFPAFVSRQTLQGPQFVLSFTASAGTASTQFATYAAVDSALSTTAWAAADQVSQMTSPSFGAIPWVPTPTDGVSFGWGGHWSETPSPGYFGAYSGMDATTDSLFFAWTDSRRHDPLDLSQRHMSIFGTRIVP